MIRYLLLNIGEVITAGDEFWDGSAWRAELSSSIGLTVEHDMAPIRRRLHWPLTLTNLPT